MKALIRKELRENFTLALLGLAILTLLFYATLDAFNQPLTGHGPQTVADFFCPILGALLGWRQIHRERHRDLRAFLIHRPLSRSNIFLAKIAAGLMLYSLAVVPPSASLIILAQWPGWIAAPFEWGMALPFLAACLTGMAGYFAGMLTASRQARWYVSRGLGLGAVLIACLLAGQAFEFWQAALIILAGGAMLGFAAWGSFQTGGSHSGLPLSGRLALIASLTLGGGVVFGAVAGLLFQLLFLQFLHQAEWSRSYYAMLKDGTICKVTQSNFGAQSITTLDGKPVADPKSRAMAIDDLNGQTANTLMLYANFPGSPLNMEPGYRDEGRFFAQGWWTSQSTLWYYSRRNQRLLGYDKGTRRFIGSLGPKGFSETREGAGDNFARTSAPHAFPITSTAIIANDTTAYQLDMEKRAASVFFTAAAGDRICGVLDVGLKGYGRDYTILATRKYVLLFTPEGQLVWKVPFDLGSGHPTVSVSFLDDPGQFAVWFNPSLDPRIQSPDRPTQVTWVNRDGAITKSVELPPLARFQVQQPGIDIIEAATPSLFWMAMPSFMYHSKEDIQWRKVRISMMVAAVLFLPAGWWLCRRYNFGAAATLGWSVFLLLGSWAGFIAFLCAHDWPAREECSNCKRLRVVDREKCEHCGADFAPPTKNGTEIFEPLGSS